MTLQEAIKYVKEACKENEIYPSPESILDCSTRIYISGNISQSKRENIKAINSQGKISKSDLPPFTSSQKVDNSPSSPDNKLITDKQKKQLEKNKDYFKEQGIDISTIKTSKEAWILLNKLYNGEI